MRKPKVWLARFAFCIFAYRVTRFGQSPKKSLGAFCERAVTTFKLMTSQVVQRARPLSGRIWPLGRQRVNEFIQIISFFERSSFKLRCETVIGIVLYCSHQACCLLYYLWENNNGIHIYQFTIELLFPDVVVVSDLNKNIGGSTDLVKKRHGSADLHTPIHPPRISKESFTTCLFRSELFNTSTEKEEKRSSFDG